jgi:hypothetical protein
MHKESFNDAVPIDKFILSILHIIIGVGNTVVDAFLEWIKERVEQLHPDEVVARINPYMLRFSLILHWKIMKNGFTMMEFFK